MSEQQVRELAARLRRVDYDNALAPGDPYEVLAREALAWHREQNAQALRPGGLLEVPRGTLSELAPEPPARPAISDEKLALELRQAAYDAGGGHPDYYKPQDLGEAPIRKFWLAAARRARELLPAARATSREPTSTKALALQFLARRAEKAPVTPPEPAPPPEATQVAGEPADAATAATGGWKGKRLYCENYYVRTEDEDDQLVAVICPGKGFKGDGVTDYFCRLHNAALDRSAALPRERLASRWSELQADKERLDRTVDFLVEKAAAAHGQRDHWMKRADRYRDERDAARRRAEAAYGSAGSAASAWRERDELQRLCRWAAVRFGELGQGGYADIMIDLQPVPGGEEGQDG